MRALLAYLVRRLLENGANTSFVNQIADPDLAIETLVQDPVQVIEQYAAKEGQLGLPHPAIPLPRDLYGPGAATRWVTTWRAKRPPVASRGSSSNQDGYAAGPLLAGQAGECSQGRGYSDGVCNPAQQAVPGEPVSRGLRRRRSTRRLPERRRCGRLGGPHHRRQAHAEAAAGGWAPNLA